ncbi:unnamed protein product [Closterium sp. Yama58-4]|nr:unnamed protein product [Closterium sp. Yama58-4]
MDGVKLNQTSVEFPFTVGADLHSTLQIVNTATKSRAIRITPGRSKEYAVERGCTILLPPNAYVEKGVTCPAFPRKPFWFPSDSFTFDAFATIEELAERNEMLYAARERAAQLAEDVKLREDAIKAMAISQAESQVNSQVEAQVDAPGSLLFPGNRQRLDELEMERTVHRREKAAWEGREAERREEKVTWREERARWEAERAGLQRQMRALRAEKVELEGKFGQLHAALCEGGLSETSNVSTLTDDCDSSDADSASSSAHATSAESGVRSVEQTGELTESTGSNEFKGQIEKRVGEQGQGEGEEQQQEQEQGRDGETGGVKKSVAGVRWDMLRLVARHKQAMREVEEELKEKDEKIRDLGKAICMIEDREEKREEERRREESVLRLRLEEKESAVREREERVCEWERMVEEREEEARVWECKVVEREGSVLQREERVREEEGRLRQWEDRLQERGGRVEELEGEVERLRAVVRERTEEGAAMQQAMERLQMQLINSGEAAQAHSLEPQMKVQMQGLSPMHHLSLQADPPSGTGHANGIATRKDWGMGRTCAASKGEMRSPL